jgi:hypothetical protein
MRAFGGLAAILVTVCAGAGPAGGYSGPLRSAELPGAQARAAFGASGARAAVCSAPASGPSTAPAGAVTVNPAVAGDLPTKASAYPAGTTFWLAPGVHTLGAGALAQVIPKTGDTFLGAPSTRRT